MPGLTACGSLDFPREGLLRIALFVHHMGAEAVNVVGKKSPCRCGAREDVRVRYYPRWVIVSARVNELKGGESVKNYTEASATRWAKRIVQKPPVVRRTMCVCTG
jgi:hypothetical protein